MKKFISVVLSVVILMSMMVTGLTVGAASTDKATINGKEVSVGSKVSYKIDLQTASKLEAVQGVVNYDSSILKVDSFTMPSTTSNFMSNTNIAGEVHYSAYSVDGDFDFSTQKNYITVEFTVIKAGTCTTSHDWEVLDDSNSKTLLDGNKKPVSSVKETATTEVTPDVPSDTAIINGVKCKVGSTVTFNVWVKTPKAVEDYQGVVSYSNDLLEAKSINCKTTGATVFSNVDAEVDGKKVVLYNWTDFMHPLDFTTEDKFITVVFDVKASGTGFIENYIKCFDDVNDKPIIDKNVIMDSDTTVRSEVIPSEVPPETSTTSTTTSSTTPQPTKTTLNGKEVNVGDEVTVTYNIQADKLCEDFQGYFNYGNKTTGDTTGIQLTSMKLKDLPGTILNTDPVGQAVFTGSSPVNPYDFRTKSQFITATFKITKANCAYFATADMYILSAVDGTDYVNRGEVKNEYTWESTTGAEPTTTSSTTTPSGDYAIINGVKCKVGSTITFNIYVKTPYLVQDYEGYVKYSRNLLKPTSIKCKETTSTAFTNLDNTMHTPGDSVVSFNWVNIRDFIDFSNEGVLASITFDVTAAGTGSIEEEIRCLDDKDDNYLIDYGTIVDKDTTLRTEVVPAEEPTTTSTTSTTTSTTTPRPTKTTFNGKDVKVGDEVTVTYYIQTEKLCEDFQGYFYYGNKTTSDTTGIELKSFYIREDLPGLMCNTAPAGKIVFTGVSPLNPYDFRTKGKFISATFKVNEANYDYFANAVFDVLSAVDGTNYVNFGKIENPFVWEQETDVPKPTTTTSSTTATTSTTTATTTTKPTTATTVTSTTKPAEKVKVRYNLTNVTSSNTATEIEKNEVYTTILSPAKGYQISSVVLVVDGNIVPVNKNADGTYLITAPATGDITISAYATEIPPTPSTTSSTTSTTTTKPTTATSTTKPPVTTYKVTNNLTNVVTNNSATSIEKGKVYTAVLSPVKGYEISTVVLIVNNEVVQATKNADGTYLISVVATGDITISAYANVIPPEPTTTSSTTSTTTSTSTTTVPPRTTFKVTNNLTNVVTNNNATTVNKNEVYTAILSPVKGYEISTVVVVSNGEVVPVNKNTDGTYLISVVASGDITISAYASEIPPTPSTTTSTTSTTSTSSAPKTFTVNAMLNNAVSTNDAKTAVEGSMYSAIIAPIEGYEMVTFVATMNGQQIEPVKSGNTYIITTKVTGNINIVAYAEKKVVPTTATSATTVTTATTATTAPKTYNVNVSLTNAKSTNNATTAVDGSSYNTIITPEEGYEIKTIVATVGGNVITPVKSGDAYVISTTVTGDINIVASAEKKVAPTTATTATTATTSPVPTSESIPETKPSQVIEINKMEINKSSVTVKEGEKFNIVASIWPGYTTEKTVTWSVTNSRVGVVSQTNNTVLGLYDKDGKSYCTETATFTAKASGRTIIKAVSNTGLVVKCEVNVKKVATSISVNKSNVTLNAGKSTTVKATVGPNNIPSQYKGVNWTSSNKKIATVNANGVIKGISKGVCTITATSKDNTSLKKTIKVTVKQPVTSVKFNKTSVKLNKKGSSATVKVTAYPSNANVKKLTIKSENTKVAKVSKSSVNSGATIKITAVKKGTTYVRATATDGSKKYARIKVIVQK